MENRQKLSCIWDYKVAKHLCRSRVSTKQRPDLDPACLKTPLGNFCLTILMDLNFLALILNYLPLPQEGTTAEFPALVSSHDRPCTAGV